MTPPTPSRAIPITVGVALILVVAVLNAVYLVFSPLDLAPDEAHYWDWSRHLDWSYYSKGPLIAWLIRGSCELFGTTTFAVRFPAVLCSAFTVLALFLLARRIFCERTALVCLVFALTLPPLTASAVLMTIDAPFLCCWSWALLFVHRAIFDGKRNAWFIAGAFVALGVMAKYTMLAFPVIVAMFHWNHRLDGRGFRTMTLVGCLGLLPIIVWNAMHDWLSLRHLFGQAGFATGPKIGFKWYGPFDYLAGQFGFLGGYWFCAFVAAACRFRPWRHREFAFLWWFSVPMVLALLPFSLRVKVQPNWPAVAYLPGFLIAVAWLLEQLQSTSRSYRRLVIALLVLGTVVNLALCLVVRFPQLAVPIFAIFAPEPSDDRLAPLRNLDPTARLRGWKYLAGELDKLRNQIASEDGEQPTIATMTWTVPGEMGFYCKGNPHVYSFGSVLDDRFSQYDIWRPNPLADAQAFRGRTFVYIGETIPNSETVFEKWDGPIRVEYRENGVTVGGWKLWIGRGFKGFPEAANKRRQF